MSSIRNILSNTADTFYNPNLLRDKIINQLVLLIIMTDHAKCNGRKRLFNGKFISMIKYQSGTNKMRQRLKEMRARISMEQAKRLKCDINGFKTKISQEDLVFLETTANMFQTDANNFGIQPGMSKNTIEQQSANYNHSILFEDSAEKHAMILNGTIDLFYSVFDPAYQIPQLNIFHHTHHTHHTHYQRNQSSAQPLSVASRHPPRHKHTQRHH